MSGAIMPEPLANPAIFTSPPGSATVAQAPLGKVSVVMMARAASEPLPASSAATRSPTLAMMRSWGRRSPITPVELVKTRVAGRPVAAATASQIAATEPSPALPVKALELPEFTMIAAPSSLSEPILAWQSSTLAERVAERVKTPATTEPGSRRVSITSVRPAYRTPAATEAKRTPSITGRSGNAAGARGETDVILATYSSRSFMLDSTEVSMSALSVRVTSAAPSFSSI